MSENAERRQAAKDLAAGRAKLRAALAVVGIVPCGDNSCMFGSPGGMATNGGCRCLDHACIDAHRIPPEARAFIRRLARACRLLSGEMQP